jgi:adenylate cyclase, class 2
MVSRTRGHREIEVKLRVADLGALIAKLRGLGAVSHGRVLEQNTLYDTPESRLRHLGRLLRVRIETPAGTKLVRPGTPSAVLTSKAPIPKPARRPSPALRYKEKLENEVPLRHPHELTLALRSLGFRPGFRYEKYRSTFRLHGLHLDLDETPVGTFLELEGPPKAIDRAARALGFTARDYMRATYWDLYAADCRRRAVKPGNMLFRA